MEQNENTLSVLKIAPGQYPQQVEIDNDLKALQQAVGGSIGASYPFEDPVAIVYNDDGKLMGLPLNRALWDEDGLMYDVIAGTFLVVGLGEEDFAYGKQESRTFLQGAQRTGACAAGQHCKNGSRYKCPDAACGSASSGRGLASV